MLKILSFITGRKIVYLLNKNGEVTKSIESKKENPFTNTKYCYYYWSTNEAFINLCSDGTTTGSSYIIKWSY